MVGLLVQRIGFAALGGHITTQNLTFKTIIEELGRGYEFLGLEDGFKAFISGNMHALAPESFTDGFGRVTTGFYSGASRYSLTDPKTGEPLPDRIQKATDFIRTAKLNYVIGSGGDDHGRQLKVLSDALKKEGIECKVLVANKTMDGDIGGKDGETIDGFVAPFTDTSNGYVAAVSLISNSILQAYADAWTNNVPVIVTHFGEKSNFVAYGAGWYGHADLVFPGELLKEHPGWPLELIADRIKAAQSENLRRYGRKVAIVDVPEGSKVQGIEHISKQLVDAHGHRKMHPELLAIALKESLKLGFSMDVHTLTFTYEARTFTQPDFPYSLNPDFEIARESGRVLAEAIKRDDQDLETTIRISDGKVTVGLAPIHLVTQKRLTTYSQFPWFDPYAFKVRPEFGRYYDPLFGPRVERERFFPRKPQVVNVYSQ